MTASVVPTAPCEGVLYNAHNATQTQTRTEYWDLAGGERKINYEFSGTRRMIHATSPLIVPSKMD